MEGMFAIEHRRGGVEHVVHLTQEMALRVARDLIDVVADGSQAEIVVVSDDPPRVVRLPGFRAG